MRLRPRSIRVRDTLIAAVVALTTLVALSISIGFAYMHYASAILLDIHRAAARVDAAIRKGTLTDPIPEASGADLIQVVYADGQVGESTEGAAGRGPMSDVRPSVATDPVVVTECPESGDPCMRIVAIRSTNDPDSPVVYAGRELPWIMTGHGIEYMAAILIMALAGCVALATWKIVGRTLRPIEGVRAQLAEISMSDLSRRVPEPKGNDEIARLARTANETLGRLQASVERQRRFAADAAHELRTPIAALSVTLEDAAMFPDDTDLPTLAQTGLRHTGKLESLVSDLLLLARLGTGGAAAQQPVDLAELADAEASRRDADIHTNLAAGAVVTGVSCQLTRLLNNLVDNAVRHADSTVEVSVARHEGIAVLTVTDDGPGIPVADRERVFERFARLDSARSRYTGGTGLGLAIARDIAQAHGGTLRVEDSSRGARLVLRIPIAVR
jgi:signal transduction histidine kinase